MINRANEMGITVKELAEQYISEYKKDAAGLNVMPPDSSSARDGKHR